MVSSLTSVNLFERGWKHIDTLNVSGIAASSAISTWEQIGFLMPWKAAPLFGVEWLGKWVSWDHPTQGRFAGQIVDYHVKGDSGTVELTAYGFSWLLNRRITGRQFAPVMGPAGAIVSNLLAKSELDLGMPYNLQIDERGPHVNYEFRLDTVASGIDALALASGQEWDSWVDVDYTFQFIWSNELGRTDSADITFTDGVDCLLSDIDGTIAETVNDLAALADDEQYADSAGARVQSLGSIARFGRLQAARRYVGLVTRSTLGPRAQNDLRRAALPTEMVTIRAHHLSPKLTTIRNGTRLRFVSPATNAVYIVRVMSRGVSMDEGIVTLVCEVIADITRAADYERWRWGGIPALDGA